MYKLKDHFQTNKFVQQTWIELLNRETVFTIFHSETMSTSLIKRRLRPIWLLKVKLFANNYSIALYYSNQKGNLFRKTIQWYQKHCKNARKLVWKKLSKQDNQVVKNNGSKQKPTQLTRADTKWFAILFIQIILQKLQKNCFEST